MSSLSRRGLLRSSVTAGAGLVALAGLSACAGGATGNPMTPQVVIDDANNAVQALGAAVTNLAISQPTLIPAAVVTSIKTYTADAASILATLSASVAATQGATVLNQVAADLQAVLNALAGIPGLPPQVTTITAAASVVLPFIVAFVRQYLPASAGPAVKVGISAAAMPLSQARATLAAAAK